MAQEQVINWVVLIITVGALAIGLLSVLVGKMIDGWDHVRGWWEDGITRQRARYEERAPLYGLRAMSSNQGDDDDQKSNDEPTFSSATTTPQPATTALQSGATDSNALLQGQARALAAMVKAGKIGETDGIKMVFGVSASSTNPRYQAARAALKEELAKLEPAKFRRSPEQEAAREALGLSGH